MSDQLITAVVSVVLGLIGLAALATFLSSKASTSKVIGAAAGGLSTDIQAATAPVTGNAPSSLGGGYAGSYGNGL